MSDTVRCDALISSDGLYRYRLSRMWGTGEPLVFVGLNPSTADATTDDPTIRKCMKFARREAAPGLVMLNLFAWRSPSPAILKKVMLAKRCAVGPECDQWLKIECAGRRVVACWGAHGRLANRDVAVYRILQSAAREIVCFGSNGDSTPVHPLYQKDTTPLVAFDILSGAQK